MVESVMTKLWWEHFMDGLALGMCDTDAMKRAWEQVNHDTAAVKADGHSHGGEFAGADTPAGGSTLLPLPGQAGRRSSPCHSNWRIPRVAPGGGGAVAPGKGRCERGLPAIGIAAERHSVRGGAGVEESRPAPELSPILRKIFGPGWAA